MVPRVSTGYGDDMIPLLNLACPCPKNRLIWLIEAKNWFSEQLIGSDGLGAWAALSISWLNSVSNNHNQDELGINEDEFDDLQSLFQVITQQINCRLT